MFLLSPLRIPELLEIILAYLVEGPTGRKDLLTCTLVCRDWYRSTHPLLYRSLHVKCIGSFEPGIEDTRNPIVRGTVPAAHGTFHDFVRFVTLRPHIARSVRRLVLEILPPLIDDITPRIKRYTISSTALQACIQRLPSLTDLDLRDVIIRSPLRMQPSAKQHIDVLGISYPRLGGRTTWDDLQSLCQIYCTAAVFRVVEFGFAITVVEVDWFCAIAAPRMQVNHLQVSLDVHAMPSYFLCLFKSMNFKDSYPLQRLDILGLSPCRYRQLQVLLKHLGPVLRSLRCEHSPGALWERHVLQLDNYPLDFAGCTGLEALEYCFTTRMSTSSYAYDMNDSSWSCLSLFLGALSADRLARLRTLTILISVHDYRIGSSLSQIQHLLRRAQAMLDVFVRVQVGCSVSLQICMNASAPFPLSSLTSLLRRTM